MAVPKPVTITFDGCLFTYHFADSGRGHWIKSCNNKTFSYGVKNTIVATRYWAILRAEAIKAGKNIPAPPPPPQKAKSSGGGRPSKKKDDENCIKIFA
jgi:hypothetical protein